MSTAAQMQSATNRGSTSKNKSRLFPGFRNMGMYVVPCLPLRIVNGVVHFEGDVACFVERSTP